VLFRSRNGLILYDRLSEKGTQTRQLLIARLRNRRFIYDSSLLLLANVIVTILGIIRTPVMTWILPKEEIGMIGVLSAWIAFVQLTSLTGLDTSIYHYIAKGFSQAFPEGTAVRLKWSFLSSILFLIASIYWFYKGDTSLAWMFVITGISFPLTNGLSACAGMLSAQQRFKSLFWYRIWESLTDFTGFIPLAFSAWWISRVVTFYTANIFATAIMQFGVSYVLYQQLRNQNKTKMLLDDKNEMVRYGKHLTVINSISTIQSRTDSLVVGMFLPLVTMADYSIGMLVSEQLKKLWVIYTTLRYPKLVKMNRDLRRKRFLIEGVIILLGFVICSIAIMILAHIFIPIILPPSYKSSIPYIDILTASFAVSVPGIISELYFRTEQNEKRQYLIRTVSAIAGIIFPLSFSIFWGGYGVAYGRLLANLTLSFVGILIFLQE
jgi:O-antigen/teichoic acid export membrane protein